MFKEGRESVEDEPRVGRPSTSRTAENEQHLRYLLNTDWCLSVRMISEQLGMDKMVVHKIISEDLGMKKICTKLVPKVLTDVHKQSREAVSKDLLERVEEDPHFFNNVITGEESWFFQYDPETKRQSNEWHTPQSSRQKKARMSKSRMKAMLIVFFDKNGVVHSEFVPEGQTVNGAFYVEVLKRLKQRVNLPPFSPELASSDFFLFPKVNTALKGRHHGILGDVKRACKHALKDVSVGDFQGAYEAWKRRLQKCVHAQGAYFEDY
ncbi:histone-lysine N-methyltransferase SETMAR [Trichonephila clavipes]|nr:histone-lysine N-methyltransferase SETMAR [Trichonephila clavipes]